MTNYANYKKLIMIVMLNTKQNVIFMTDKKSQAYFKKYDLC